MAAILGDKNAGREKTDKHQEARWLEAGWRGEGAMHAIAAENGQHGAEWKVRVRRSAIEIDAGQMKHEREEGRVSTDGVKTHDHRQEREYRRAPFARGAAGEAQADDGGERQGAEVDFRHVARQRQVVLAPDRRRGRPPEFFKWAIDAEQIGDDARQQGHGRHRAATGASEIDGGAVGLRRQRQREGDGNRRHDDAADETARQRRQRAAQARQAPLAVDQEPDDPDRQRIGAQQADLIAPERHEARDDA